jgi:predicted O-methyltransferase YrrM
MKRLSSNQRNFPLRCFFSQFLFSRELSSGRLFALGFLIILSAQVAGQDLQTNVTLDRQVEKFLKENKNTFRDMNVPEKDGELLYDLILKGKYTRALEIGTSTGYSGIYMAWALSKTGGKLITIEINESRHKTALKNFEEAGLSDYIDARLADAHVVVKELPGPFDFVFSDADKNWYTRYFDFLDPKLEVGGCYTTHNISEDRGGWNYDYLQYIRSLDHYDSKIHPGSSMLISYKKADK